MSVLYKKRNFTKVEYTRALRLKSELFDLRAVYANRIRAKSARRSTE